MSMGLRVLQISKFYPPVMGGIESVAWELTEGLNRDGVRTDVLCSNQRPFTSRELTDSGYNVLRSASLGMWLSTSMAPAMAWQLRALLADQDVLHVHMPDPTAAFALWFARPKSRVVLHWHSDVVRQRKAMHLYEPLQQWLLRRADAIIATSPPYADSSIVLRPWRHKVEVIPIGISDNRNESCSIKAAEICQRYRGRRIIFSLGRMTYYKGFDVLINAAELLPSDCVVLIGGDGDLLNYYKTLVAKRGLAGKVHLLGQIPDHELASHFEACDVFCMPSTARAEAYGVAMLEAMVMRKPIVATDITGSGVPWVNIHGSTGFNVPVGEVAPLAQALTRLLDDEPLRQKMGAAAGVRYLKEFNARQMTEKVLDLYRRIGAVPA